MTWKEAVYRKKAAELICRDIKRSGSKGSFITIELAEELRKTFPVLSDDEIVDIFQDVDAELYGYLKVFPDIIHFSFSYRGKGKER